MVELGALAALLLRPQQAGAVRAALQSIARARISSARRRLLWRCWRVDQRSARSLALVQFSGQITLRKLSYFITAPVRVTFWPSRSANGGQLLGRNRQGHADPELRLERQRQSPSR